MFAKSEVLKNGIASEYIKDSEVSNSLCTDKKAAPSYNILHLELQSQQTSAPFASSSDQFKCKPLILRIRKIAKNNYSEGDKHFRVGSKHRMSGYGRFIDKSTKLKCHFSTMKTRGLILQRSLLLKMYQFKLVLAIEKTKLNISRVRDRLRLLSYSNKKEDLGINHGPILLRFRNLQLQLQL